MRRNKKRFSCGVVLMLMAMLFLGAALQATTYNEKQVKKLAKRVNSKSVWKSKAAIEKLGTINDYRVIPILLDAMNLHEGFNSDSVRKAISKITDPRVADAFISYLQDPGTPTGEWTSERGVRLAIKSLIRLKDTRAGECFLAVLDNTSYSESHRIVAAAALLEIGYKVSFERINAFMRGKQFTENRYLPVVNEVFKYKDPCFLEFFETVMTSNHPENAWKGLAAKTVFELAGDVESELRDKARRIKQKYAQEHEYLTQRIFYNLKRQPETIILFSPYGERIARRDMVFGLGTFSKVSVKTIDIVTGNIIQEFKTYIAAGEIIIEQFLCLDDEGKIIYKDGEPVLIDRSVAIRTAHKRNQRIYPCKNCAAETGNKNCRYVW